MAKKIMLTGVLLIGLLTFLGCEDNGSGDANGSGYVGDPVVLLAFNDLGMHCMNEDFSQFMILPPFNNLHAQLIEIADPPRIVTSKEYTLHYSIPGNSYSDGKTNFWDYIPMLIGINLPPDKGLTGNGLEGSLTPTVANDWAATGIPLTPRMDNGDIDPFQLASLHASSGLTQVAETVTVIPVSWEIRCDLCHAAPGQPVFEAPDILTAHDRLHGTNLNGMKPVFCGLCHWQPELGALSQGMPGVENLSRAMHNAHAMRIMDLPFDVKCYACHPGPETQCLRDVHATKGMTCYDCHTSMEAVAEPNRTPWVDMPRCDNCHNVAGHEYEQPGVLYRNSKGHGGVECAICHNSPHAITPTSDWQDNQQALDHQGMTGAIRDCTVCHETMPAGEFKHTLSAK